MAQAGVSYTWGREAIDGYSESLAGVRDQTPLHQFRAAVSPRGRRGTLLPEVMPRSADRGRRRRQARPGLQLPPVHDATPANRVPWPKPARLRRRRATSCSRAICPRSKRTLGRPLAINDVMKADMLQNGKTDTNNNGAFSTDYIGGSYDYPEGSYATRARIRQAHVDYIQGFLYFLAHRSARARQPVGGDEGLGLCRDEFVDTDHWPHQLYVREARRMVGEYVMSQKDIQTELDQARRDRHGLLQQRLAQRAAPADGGRRRRSRTKATCRCRSRRTRFPYRVMLPKRAEATNLLVPVCFSATHVAYSTLRMEPQYMIIGQAAGVAAKLAIDGGVAGPGRGFQDPHNDSASATRSLRVQAGVRAEH